MRIRYDTIYLTNLPAFYKINLFNEINKKKKILVIFTGEDAGIRNQDFYHGAMLFDYYNLKEYNLLRKNLKMMRILFSTSYKELVLGGWDSLSLWIAVLFSAKTKNSLMIESSEFESKTDGLKGIVKRIFLNRINKIYASGTSQKKLVEKLGFKDEIRLTKGVGIFNIIPQPPYIKKNKVKSFLYVGRLSPEKNLFYLIETFNNISHLELNIIGTGPLEKLLKEIARENINFLGAINNKELSIIYQKNDVFILPSISEPWGLVVEEALNNGLPVILSNNVGCSTEIIKNDYNGLIFTIDEIGSLKQCIEKIQDINYYNNLRYNISFMDFQSIKREQITSYL